MSTHHPLIQHPPHAPRSADTLDELAERLTGTLSRPGDADYDRARAAWQLLADQRPAAVVTAADPIDIATTVRAAAGLQLRVAVQATGHNAVPLSDLRGSLLLRTGRLNRVSVDADTALAHIEAGASWHEVHAATEGTGLAAIGGFAPHVGVVGFLLGGGLGWFARSHGHASDAIVGFDVVTADGVQRRADAHSEPDLFRALLAGADVAVITAVDLRLYPISEVVAGALFWPVESAREVFHAWAGWAVRLPETVTSAVRVLRFPAAPEVPPHFSGRAFAIVEAVVQAEREQADALLAPLRRLRPIVDTIGAQAPQALGALHMDPPQPAPALGTTAVLSALPPATIDALLDVVLHGPAQQLVSVELRQLGGALDRAASAAVAGARALLYGVSITPSPEALAIAQAGLAALHDAVAPVRAPRVPSSFAEVPQDAATLFGEEAAALRAVKRRWDAEDRIHANHSVLTTRPPV